MRTLLVILLGLPAGLGGNARQDGTWQKYENGNWQAAQTPQSERARAQTAKSPPAPPQPRTRAERQGGLPASRVDPSASAVPQRDRAVGHTPRADRFGGLTATCRRASGHAEQSAFCRLAK